MTGPVASYFTAAERERLHAAVRAAEIRTSVTLCPVLVSESDAYDRSADVMGLFGALLAALLLMAPYGADAVPLYVLLPAQFAGFLAGALGLGRIPALRYILAGRALMERRVRQAAERALATASRGERPCVLIYVSLFERQVVLLADPEVSVKVRPEAWSEAVTLIRDGLREGKAADGLCFAIERCAAATEAYFPGSAAQQPVA